jgi:hypothetical protein
VHVWSELCAVGALVSEIDKGSEIAPKCTVKEFSAMYEEREVCSGGQNRWLERWS